MKWLAVLKGFRKLMTIKISGAKPRKQIRVFKRTGDKNAIRAQRNSEQRKYACGLSAARITLNIASINPDSLNKRNLLTEMESRQIRIAGIQETQVDEKT